MANGNLSEALLGEGDVAGSVEAAQAALTLYRRLPSGARTSAEVRKSQGVSYYNLGRALLARAANRRQQAAQSSNDVDEACQRYHQALDILRDLKDSASIAPGDLQPDTVRKAMLRCPPQSRAPA